MLNKFILYMNKSLGFEKIMGICGFMLIIGIGLIFVAMIANNSVHPK